MTIHTSEKEQGVLMVNDFDLAQRIYAEWDDTEDLHRQLGQLLMDRAIREGEVV